jgi:putative membrane protein
MRKRGIHSLTPAVMSAALVLAGATIAIAADAPNSEIAPVLNELHHSNQKEMHMGQEAKEKGNLPTVKEYGATLERDHTAADEKVAALARKRNIELTDPPANEPKHVMAPGVTFDKEFAKMMVDDHHKDIAKVKAESQKTTDTELKQLLDDLLPTLEKHLATAQALADGKQPETAVKVE